MQLNNLASLVKKRKIVGRGGNRGGTSTRGHKGQRGRSGGSVGPIFEGGQMPLSRRLPKRGFSNAPFKVTYEIINLERLSKIFEDNSKVTQKELLEKGVIKSDKNGLIKILGSGTLDKKLVIYAHAFSKSAEVAIKAQGGEVHLIKER